MYMLSKPDILSSVQAYVMENLVAIVQIQIQQYELLVLACSGQLVFSCVTIVTFPAGSLDIVRMVVGHIMIDDQPCCFR